MTDTASSDGEEQPEQVAEKKETQPLPEADLSVKHPLQVHTLISPTQGDPQLLASPPHTSGWNGARWNVTLSPMWPLREGRCGAAAVVSMLRRIWHHCDCVWCGKGPMRLRYILLQQTAAVAAAPK